MKTLLAVMLLTVAHAAMANVTIVVQDAPHPIACPMPQPTMEKQKDGSYVRRMPNSINAVNCMDGGSSHTEEWTDYPENGGKATWTPQPFSGGSSILTPMYTTNPSPSIPASK